MERPDCVVPIVEDIQRIETRGPWDTKSGGRLDVIFAMSLATVQEKYLRYEDAEIKRVPKDIRGLRVYTVRDLPKGKIGGTEFQRIREEMIFVLEGSVLWTCEDLFGDQKNFVLNNCVGVWMPPFILHTYEALEEKSGLLVIANTLYDPDDSGTYDTYTTEEFRELQKEFLAKDL